jgi:protoheme IX farnesyltransferase
VTGQVEPGALLLFATILVWTPPHFWALAIHRREDYRRAEIPMLPVTHGIAFTATRILQYSVVLLGVTVLPVAIGMSGWLYLAGAVALGAGFVGFAWRLRRDSRWAMPTFKYSIAYLFLLFALLLADRAVAPLLY